MPTNMPTNTCIQCMNVHIYMCTRNRRQYRNNATAHLVDGIPDAEILQAHLLLLASVLLHECNEARALPITIVIFSEVNNVLRVVGEGGVIATTTGSAAFDPVTCLHDRVPVFHCEEGRTAHCVLIPYLLTTQKIKIKF